MYLIRDTCSILVGMYVMDTHTSGTAPEEIQNGACVVAEIHD